MGNVSPSANDSKAPRVQEQMSFAGLLLPLQDGARLTRVAWEDPEVYITMKDDLLMVIDKAKGGQLAELTLHRLDLFSDDWVTV